MQQAGLFNFILDVVSLKIYAVIGLGYIEDSHADRSDRQSYKMFSNKISLMDAHPW